MRSAENIFVFIELLASSPLVLVFSMLPSDARTPLCAHLESSIAYLWLRIYPDWCFMVRWWNISSGKPSHMPQCDEVVKMQDDSLDHWFDNDWEAITVSYPSPGLWAADQHQFLGLKRWCQPRLKKEQSIRMVWKATPVSESIPLGDVNTVNLIWHRLRSRPGRQCQEITYFRKADAKREFPLM